MYNLEVNINNFVIFLIITQDKDTLSQITVNRLINKRPEKFTDFKKLPSCKDASYFNRSTKRMFVK